MSGRVGTGSLHIDISENAADEIEVRVSGELDLCTSSQLQGHMSGLEGRKTTVILDLRAVSFLDSTGLRALWTIRQQMASAGGTLLLRSPSDAVARVLRLTKLDKVFELVSVAEANESL